MRLLLEECLVNFTNDCVRDPNNAKTVLTKPTASASGLWPQYSNFGFLVVIKDRVAGYEITGTIVIFMVETAID